MNVSHLVISLLDKSDSDKRFQYEVFHQMDLS